MSITEIQELVRHLPAAKLPEAYRILRDMVDQDIPASPQVEFMRLPLEERRRMLSQQAAEMAEHYEQSGADRQDWQCGDFQDAS